MAFKFGYVSVIGKPNVGKSSLINAIIGQKVCIISPKTQTTRNKILAIYNKPDCFQMVFVDTPGIQSQKSELGNYMTRATNSSLEDTDAVLIMLSAVNITDTDYKLIERFKDSKVPVFVVVNKMDISKDIYLAEKVAKLNEYGSFVKKFLFVSALKHKKMQTVVDAIEEVLPEGEPMYDTDICTDRNERFLAAEIVREKILIHLREEIPHGVAVDIIKYLEDDDQNIIHADIICSSENHKKIIIGKNGNMIKNIGISARDVLKNILGKKIVLKLFVKVRENWMDNKSALAELGYGAETL